MGGGTEPVNAPEILRVWSADRICDEKTGNFFRGLVTAMLGHGFGQFPDRIGTMVSFVISLVRSPEDSA